jgi:hypothetical protein
VEKCVNCSEPVESPLGIIDLNENGLCDSCSEHLELVEILNKETVESQNFDFTLNF